MFLLWLSVTFCSSGSSGLFRRYTPAHISSLLSHHLPAPDFLIQTHTQTHTHASQLASPSSDVEVFSGWYIWSMRQFLWIFHLGSCSRTNPVSFSSWLEIMNTVFFPDEVIAPYNTVATNTFTHPLRSGTSALMSVKRNM